MARVIDEQVSPDPRAAHGGKARPPALQGQALVPTMLVRAAVHEKRVCSQPVSQLPPFLSQAFSAFFYTVDFIQTVMGKAVHLPSDLKDAAETICATSWSEVGSSGMAGRRGLLHVGHRLGSERSPWRGLCVLVPLELGKGGGWLLHETRGGSDGYEEHLGQPDATMQSFRPQKQSLGPAGLTPLSLPASHQLLQKAPKLEKRLPDYCPISMFVYLLTTKGYNFNNHSFPNIAFQKKVSNTTAHTHVTISVWH